MQRVYMNLFQFSFFEIDDKKFDLDTAYWDFMSNEPKNSIFKKDGMLFKMLKFELTTLIVVTFLRSALY